MSGLSKSRFRHITIVFKVVIEVVAFDNIDGDGHVTKENKRINVIELMTIVKIGNYLSLQSYLGIF